MNDFPPRSILESDGLFHLGPPAPSQNVAIPSASESATILPSTPSNRDTRDQTPQLAAQPTYVSSTATGGHVSVNISSNSNGLQTLLLSLAMILLIVTLIIFMGVTIYSGGASRIPSPDAQNHSGASQGRSKDEDKLGSCRRPVVEFNVHDVFEAPKPWPRHFPKKFEPNGPSHPPRRGMPHPPGSGGPNQGRHPPKRRDP